MTDEEEIQLVINGLEDGDEVIVTSGEGYYEVVTRGRVKEDRYFGCSLGVFDLHNSRVTSIQVVSKGTPKWHRAKVISAEVIDSKTPQYMVQSTDKGKGDWTDSCGCQLTHEDLENVVIIVGEDG